jgi:hypothetical protein
LPGNGFPSKAASVVPSSVINNPQVQALFHHLPLGLVNTYFGTYAPRVGFAWDLSGRQDTVLRGGFGTSYERVQGNYYYGAVSQTPFIAVASINAPGNADLLGNIGTTAAAQTISNTADPHLAPPRIYNYSLGLQHRFTSTMVFELNYVGSHSGNLTYRKNLNQGAAGTEQANPGVKVNALRPYKGYAEIYQYRNGLTSNYNSLQSRLQMNFKQGGVANLSYTWSQALTEGSTFDYQPQDSFNPHADYGPANFNQPQIFVASYVYPFSFWLTGKEWYKKVLGGWQVSGVTRISSGLPINVVQATGVSTAGNLVTTNNVAQRMNLVGNPYAHGGKQYLRSSAFAMPAPGTYGNVKYDGIKGPLFNNWDAALQKNIPIHESIGLEFRAEMFNVPNHLSLFTIANTYGSSNFGQATAATDPRTMEFVLRIHY